jgi:Zn-finger nucleic acid-binding protein
MNVQFALLQTAACPNCGVEREWRGLPDPSHFEKDGCPACRNLFLVNFDEGLHLIDIGPAPEPVPGVRLQRRGPVVLVR